METKTTSDKGSSFLVSTPTLAFLGGGMVLSLRLNAPLMAGLFLFFLLQSLASLAIAWAWQSRVETTYAMAYDELKEE